MAGRSVAYSLSDDGLRHPDHPGYSGERTGSAWVLFERPRPEIIPAQRCIEPGSRLTLDVVDARQDEIPLEVNWSTEGGAISPDGTLHVPMEPGELEVTATPVDSPEAATTASFKVGDCRECSWTFRADGIGPNLGGSKTLHGDTILLWGVDHDTGAIDGIVLYEDYRDHPPITIVAVDGQPPTGTFVANALRVIPFHDGERDIYASGEIPPDNNPAWPRPRLDLTLDWTDHGFDKDLVPTKSLKASGSGPLLVGFSYETVTHPDYPVGVMQEKTNMQIPIEGNAAIELSGTFYPPVYQVRLRSSDLLDDDVREKWFADAEDGDLFTYFDRKDTAVLCGGRAGEFLEHNDDPVWPDHRVPLTGFDQWEADDPAYFQRRWIIESHFNKFIGRGR